MENETAKILKESLKIVDELATLEFDNIDDFINTQDDLEKLIKRAKTLKKNKLWYLK